MPCLLGAGIAAWGDGGGEKGRSAIPVAKSHPRLCGLGSFFLCILSPTVSAGRDAALGGQNRGQPRFAAGNGGWGFSGAGPALLPGSGLGGRLFLFIPPCNCLSSRPYFLKKTSYHFLRSHLPGVFLIK